MFRSRQTQSMRLACSSLLLAVICLAAGGCVRPAFEDGFDPGWTPEAKGWRVAYWKQNAAQMDPSRCYADGEGHLVQIVEAGEPFLGGSIQTVDEFGHGRWVARVKPSSVPGALNSVFTKDWDDQSTPEKSDDGTWFEVDIEFLTYTFKPGGGNVHVAIHGKDGAVFGADPALDFNPSGDFHEWGFDIFPDVVIWHVDGREFYRYEKPANMEFNANYEFFFNSWTQEKWINGPPAERAIYLIDWVKFYPASSPDELPSLKPMAK